MIGRGIAWELGKRGVEVVLLDRESPHAAFKAAAGLLIPAGGRISRHHHALRRESAALYPAFVEELESTTGLSCGYRQCGTLTVAYEPGAKNAVTAMCGCLRGIGVEVEQLAREECLLREPALGERVGAGYLAQDHLVDPVALLAALAQAGEALGVESVHGTVVSVAPGEVRLATGDTISGDRVVVANGAWMAELLDLPVYPVKGETIQTTAHPELLNHCLSVQKANLYLANRGDGRYVVGATEEEAGFDNSVTATTSLWERALELVPALADSHPLETRVGFRPKVGDGLPILGEFQGLLVAGAHYRNGVLQTPITGKLMAHLILTGETPELARPFSPLRDMGPRTPRPEFSRSKGG